MACRRLCGYRRVAIRNVTRGPAGFRLLRAIETTTMGDQVHEINRVRGDGHGRATQGTKPAWRLFQTEIGSAQA